MSVDAEGYGAKEEGLDRLIADSNDEAEKSRATRALAHLYKLLQNQESLAGRPR